MEILKENLSGELEEAKPVEKFYGADVQKQIARIRAEEAEAEGDGADGERAGDGSDI